MEYVSRLGMVWTPTVFLNVIPFFLLLDRLRRPLGREEEEVALLGDFMGDFPPLVLDVLLEDLPGLGDFRPLDSSLAPSVK